MRIIGFMVHIGLNILLIFLQRAIVPVNLDAPVLVVEQRVFIMSEIGPLILPLMLRVCDLAFVVAHILVSRKLMLLVINFVLIVSHNFNRKTNYYLFIYLLN